MVVVEIRVMNKEEEEIMKIIIEVMIKGMTSIGIVEDKDRDKVRGMNRERDKGRDRDKGRIGR